MELIKISDTKLKIMLTAEDMAHYAIASEALNYENTETRRAVWQILDEAKQRTGFDAASDRVLIQAYPSRMGGCELYITKIAQNVPTAPGERKNGADGKMRIYAFATLSDLVALCRCLKAMDFHGDSVAYAVEDERYYLVLREDGGGIPPASVPYHPAQEFGDPVSYASTKLAYIKEHADCLCPADAVFHLAALA
ncbi:MAG: adaptor protein MecA [Clostridia bacterium]|nr:adaptor protein MecA [Clostridia bacterium]